MQSKLDGNYDVKMAIMVWFSLQVTIAGLVPIVPYTVVPLDTSGCSGKGGGKSDIQFSLIVWFLSCYKLGI